MHFQVKDTFLHVLTTSTGLSSQFEESNLVRLLVGPCASAMILKTKVLIKLFLCAVPLFEKTFQNTREGLAAQSLDEPALLGQLINSRIKDGGRK